jgi:hypothetical protein
MLRPPTVMLTARVPVVATTGVHLTLKVQNDGLSGVALGNTA